MNLGDTLINISKFLHDLWSWIETLFTYQFQIGGATVSLWTIFVGVGVAIFITVFIIRIFT